VSAEGRAAELRARILALVTEYAAAEWPEKPFVPGVTKVPVSGRVFDATEVLTLVDASLDFWLTTGRFAEALEKGLAARVGVKRAILVNSGSSAILLSVTALLAEELGERRLRPGDEVVTCATGFPTTVSPVVQNGLVPVFVDVSLPTYNATVASVAEAIGPRTRAIILAHTLGNPFDAPALSALARERGLFLIEDCCDAFGSTIGGRGVGTFGEFATLSFYPAHHITTGEGGAVLTSDVRLRKLVESLRDWGRDCWCDPGAANTCGKRFSWKLGELPEGYDHKYAYSRLGYNMKMTDMQAAVGVAQLGKLDGFIAKRRENFQALRALLADREEHLILPEATPGSEPSWFGFPITLREGAPLSRRELIDFLDARKIDTRLLFGGNLLRQPAFRGVAHRKVGDLAGADTVTERTFWVGVYPGLTKEMLEWVAGSIGEALDGARLSKNRGTAPR
jgi:CDP-6-deoxy-D-xylo-4-hexulose-3-dehydrase